jgi:hypothetical protein
MLAMSIHIKYYRIFAVKLIHEYFLLYDNNLTYFDLTTNDQKQKLEQRLLLGQYKVMDDLLIEPTDECAKILRNYRLKMVQTPTGMFVACIGKTKRLPDNSEILAPEIPLKHNLELTFRIRIQNPNFRSYTSLPFRSPTTGLYFFSNDSANASGNGFASLSKPVSAFQTNTNYLPGDLAFHGNSLKEATANTDSASFWEDTEGAGYVNENDRRLFPKTFMYYPKAEELNNPIVFTLKDALSNADIKKILVEKPALTGVRVDFSMVNSKGTDVPLSNGRYKLEIGNNVETIEKEVYLFSEFSQGDFGLISIRIGESDAAYKIIQDDGSLIQPYPEFQIRLRSRKTYWRYQAKQPDKKLEPKGTASFFNDDQNNSTQNLNPYKLLITKRPQKLSNLPIQIMDNTGALEIFPQPGPSPLKTNRIENLAPTEPPGRIYSDVYISTVNGKIGVVN